MALGAQQENRMAPTSSNPIRKTAVTMLQARQEKASDDAADGVEDHWGLVYKDKLYEKLQKYCIKNSAELKLMEKETDEKKAPLLEAESTCKVLFPMLV